MRGFFFPTVFSKLGSYLRLLTVGVLLFLASSTWGQEVVWVKTYGGSGSDRAFGLCQTSDGGYIAVGFTDSYGDGVQLYMVKTDFNGDTLWTRTHGGAGWDQGNSVQQTSDGGYIVAGWSDSYGWAPQVYLVKTDSAGNVLWHRTYGGENYEYANSIEKTSDGGYILVGGTSSYGAGLWDVYLIKTDSAGSVQWTKTYGGTVDDKGQSVQQTSDGGYIVSGFSESFGPHEYSLYLIKTDSKGDSLWTKVFCPPGLVWSDGFAVRQTQDEGYIVTGFSMRQEGPYYTDVYLVKTDPRGDTIWTRSYGGDYTEWGLSVRETSDSGYIAVGLTESFGSGSQDVYVIRTNSQGDTLWTRTFGGGGADVGRELLESPDGTYILAGETQSCGAGSFDIYLLRISPTFLESVRGDANGDEVLDIGDVVYLINYLFGDGPPPGPLPSGDPNCDGSVDLADVLYLINYLFASGAEPGCPCA